ncbi:MAG: hypothetical protein M0Q41_02960 [Bacteroidales bacterium]|nr:hypothetical protein [Bacteroidales bacterium]
MSSVIRFFISFLLVCVVNPLTAQSLAVSELKDPGKWVVGGDFGLGFSTYGSQIMLSPELGYSLLPRLEAGLRFTYSYSSYKSSGYKIQSSYYGGAVYASYHIYKGILARIENELLNYQPIIYSSNGFVEGERKWVNSIFVGGGYRQYFSRNGFGTILILYNLNETLDSPYNNPIFRMGVGFHL